MRSGSIESWDVAYRYEKKGAFATRDRAHTTWRAVERFAAQSKMVLDPKTITAKQARLFLEHRAKTISARSVQQEAAHIRVAVRSEMHEKRRPDGKTSMGDISKKGNPWASPRLSVESCSRTSLKAAMDPELYASVRMLLKPDVLATADIQHALGLRALEAVRSGETFGQWSKVLSARAPGAGVTVAVLIGTKGGRTRDVFVHPEQVERFAAALAQAMPLANSRGWVISSKKPTLESAIDKYNNALRYRGLVGDNASHGMRRAFAQESYALYRELGMNEHQALVRLSRDLGHGDKRTTYVFNSYLVGGSA